MLGMQRNRTSDNNSNNTSPIANVKTKALPEAHADVDIDVDIDVGVDAEDVDVDAVPTQKPHFLDYDAVPPPEFEESFDHALSFGIIGGGGGVQPLAESNGEQLKLDKKYERDGEISDYELAASGYTKKEFTQDDNTLHLPTASSSSASAVKAAGNGCSSGAAAAVVGFSKPKHFLDENPIPPDYMLLAEEEHALREHRSLDRNFERHSALQQQQQHQRSASPAGSARVRSSPGGVHRASRERFKEPSYTLSRFLDSNCQQQHHLLLSSSPASLPPRRMSKGGIGAVWADNFDACGRLYASLHLPTTTVANASSIAPTNSGAAAADVVAFSTVIDADTLGPKVECVYSLLSMLGSNDPLEMAKKFVELSRTAETCSTLRRSGCIPLLVQMIHSADDGGGSSTGAENSVRRLAGKALHNVVHYHPDERAGRREAKVLRLLDQIMDYCAFLRTLLQSGGEAIADDSDRHPLAAISSLMKVSFDEEHRHAMCELGALLAIPALVHLDHAVHGPRPEDLCCNSLRRYALMALTNLTFGDENNKALLCGQKLFMEALVAQLDAAPDDLLQVTASVLRNLSWRADANMKAVLNEIGTVTALARAAMHNRNENTLKAILSALWNLSAHCSTNKAEFCAVDGALAFLVRMLMYEGPSKTLKIIENAGGILRNVSSHIAVRENYRQILRAHNCLGILLQQLKSESLTVVSNSCGTLWNLSARCPEDQRFLWDNGAVPMLRSLIHSKHAMISEGSASALKNLLNFRPSLHSHSPLDPIARSMGLKQLPTLNARKQKALAQELVGRKEHTETCDNLDVSEGAKEDTTTTESGGDTLQRRRYPLTATVPTSAASLRLTRSAMLTKSESRDSVFSAKSDSIYENLMRSQSASESGRYKTMPPPPPPPPPLPPPSVPAAAPRFATTCTNVNDMVGSVAQREDDEGRDVEDDDDEEEQPIDYSVKYNEPSAATVASVVAAVDATMGSGGGGSSPVAAGTKSSYATYQETDLDQPTDFSLRYAENQIESDADADVDSTLPPTTAAESSTSKVAENRHHHQQQRLMGEDGGGSGTEILLILEDSVKCYQTEDTPYVISNAASVTDLRQGGGVGGGSGSKASASHDAAAEEHGDGDKQSAASATAPAKQQQQQQPLPTTASGKSALKRYQRNLIVGVAGGPGSGGGSYTPEKPINYCEEGTPAGYFSRYESLSSLEESPPLQAPPQADTTPHANGDEAAALLQQRTEPTESSSSAQQPRVDGKATAEAAYACDRNVVRQQHGTTATNSNSALETPLMFSRHSSMDSLLLVEVDDDDDDGRGDDKSSVVSDFSRLASGVISPSELPDSPTQSMPQSPRRNSTAPSALRSAETVGSGGAGGSGGGGELRSGVIGGGGGGSGAQLRSVFDDGLNMFHVENTPAHFSCATSLSNLSIIVDEGVVAAPPAPTDASAAPHHGGTSVAKRTGDEEDEEEEEEPEDDDDDLLLANCIDMGMKRSAKSAHKGGVATKNASALEAGAEDQALTALADEPRHYCTEDTPALLSKVGSNTNLSAISICSSSNANNNKMTNNKTGANGLSSAVGAERVERQNQRRSLNISDDVSSNVSELDDDGEGGSGGVLQQCIREGMQKASSSSSASALASAPASRAAAQIADPIAMMRRGGNDTLPPYLPVTDELMVGGQYLVEDSPCNFSLMSGLSNLTVGSSLVGPAVQLKKRSRANEREEGDAVPPDDATTEQSAKGRQQPPLQWLDDSLSSLSIDSEDDTNLLSQAIAAGCNRPKSNLGFSSSSASIVAGKRSASLSASQPIMNGGGAATSSSLHTVAVVPNAPLPLPPRHYRQRQRHQTPGKQHSRNNNHHQHHNNNNNNGGGDGNESYSSVDSSDSNDNQQSKSLLELCIQTGMQKATTPVHQQQQQHHHHDHHNSRRQQLLAGASGAITGSGGRCKSGAAVPFFFTQSNPNLKQFDAFSSPQQQQRIFAATGGTSGANRHQRDRERKDERLLLECINTGITKKIAAGGAGIGGTPDIAAIARMTPRREQQQQQQQQQPPPPSNNSTVPKNVPATSAAAPGICRPFPSANCNSNTNSNTTSNTNSTTTTSSTAAPGVENNTTTISIINNSSSSRIITLPVCTTSTANNNCSISMSQCSSSRSSRSRSTTIRSVDGIATSPETQRNLPPRTMADGASPPSPESVRATTNATGCSSRRSSYSMSTAAMLTTSATTASDESNESFIMETTTVSLMELPPPPSMQSSTRTDKHKDPDLMLKSVERLTLEFVSSAEQLRSCDAQDAASRRLGSISSGGGGSGGGGVISHSTNNTWNEDTCPNDDVSFPSVSVSAPVVASLNYDEDEEEEEEEDDNVDLATDALVDHGELHDFAEITPTNEAQPQYTEMVEEDEDEQQQRREREQLLLSLLQGDNNRTQPSSLGTETETDADTLINGSPPPHNSSVRRAAWMSTPTTTNSSGHSGGIQFQLGGAVQSAAAGGLFYSQQQQQRQQHQHQHHNHLAAMTTMTNSTILACEARALADHIQALGGDEHNDDDYQMASLDLDNVRPPSGMESLNMSGHYNNYYHDMSPSPAHSLQLQQRHAATAQLFASATRSPKLPRKTLPAGLMARRALGSTLPPQLAGSADSINSSSCQMLLDNIRPPSLMDELLDSMMSVSSIQSEVADGDVDVDATSMATTLSAASLSQYETAAAGGAFDYDAFDDNTVTLQSCCDALPPDGDADSAATPLPSDDCDADGDGDFSSAESSPKKQLQEASTPATTSGRRILTAKQKRNLSKDRFKTYTIAADALPLPLPAYPTEPEDEHDDEVLQIEIVETPVAAADARGGGERRARRSSHDRYRTQIIECPVRLLRPDSGDATPPANYCSSLTTSTDDCPSDDGQLSSIRAMTSRFKFINAAATATPTTTASEEDSGGQTTPVVAPPPPPPPESDSNNSIECDQNSETESCHGHADKMLLLLASDDDDSATARRLQIAAASRPRIVVPRQCQGVAEEDAATPTNENAKCAVRGRRKPAYVSPYSMQYQQQRCASTTATARVLPQQQNNNQSSSSSSSNKRATTPAGSVAAKMRPPAPPQRQGTFVKDEPTTTTLASGAPIPIVASPTKRSSVTKLPTKRAISAAAATTGTGPSAAAAAAVPLRRAIGAKTTKVQMPRRLTTTTTTATTVTTTRTRGATAAPQRSNSNATIRVTSRAARIAVLAQRVSATTPPSRSNSNLNGRASTATAVAATRINQAQSRIAGILRSVDDPKSKSKPQTQTQTKTAMSGGARTKTPQTKTATAVTNVRSKQLQPQQPQTLIRSTTFDSTPTMLADTPTVGPGTPIAVHK